MTGCQENDGKKYLIYLLYVIFGFQRLVLVFKVFLCNSIDLVSFN